MTVHETVQGTSYLEPSEAVHRVQDAFVGARVNLRAGDLCGLGLGWSPSWCTEIFTGRVGRREPGLAGGPRGRLKARQAWHFCGLGETVCLRGVISHECHALTLTLFTPPPPSPQTASLHFIFLLNQAVLRCGGLGQANGRGCPVFPHLAAGCF